MKQLRYLILLFNLAYKDGKYDESQDPYFSCSVIILAFQYSMLLISFFFLDEFIEISNHFKFIHPKVIIVALLAFLGLLNYYFFAKRKKFDRFYDEFKNAPINTTRNRRIGYGCLVLYWVMIFVVIGNLKDWLS